MKKIMIVIIIFLSTVVVRAGDKIGVATVEENEFTDFKYQLSWALKADEIYTLYQCPCNVPRQLMLVYKKGKIQNISLEDKLGKICENAGKKVPDCNGCKGSPIKLEINPAELIVHKAEQRLLAIQKRKEQEAFEMLKAREEYLEWLKQNNIRLGLWPARVNKPLNESLKQIYWFRTQYWEKKAFEYNKKKNFRMTKFAATMAGKNLYQIHHFGNYKGIPKNHRHDPRVHFWYFMKKLKEQRNKQRAYEEYWRPNSPIETQHPKDIRNKSWTAPKTREQEYWSDYYKRWGK